MAVLQLPVAVDGMLSIVADRRLIKMSGSQLTIIARSSITIATLSLGAKHSRRWRTLAELPGRILRPTVFGVGDIRGRLLGVTILRVVIARLIRTARLLMGIRGRG